LVRLLKGGEKKKIVFDVLLKGGVQRREMEVEGVVGDICDNSGKGKESYTTNEW
jgi:hypothetical protein